MEKSRTVALHAAHVALAEPQGLTGAPRDLRGLGLTNWHTANTANKVIILHQMLNGRDKDLAETAQNELWEVSQQTGAMGVMTTSPCCPSNTPWWGRTAVPRSWALQTWIEMAKYGIDTNAMLEDSEQPREHDRHIMGCCPLGREQEVFKWSDETAVRWLSQLCDKAGTQIRTEALNRLTSDASVPNATGQPVPK